MNEIISLKDWLEEPKEVIDNPDFVQWQSQQEQGFSVGYDPATGDSTYFTIANVDTFDKKPCPHCGGTVAHTKPAKTCMNCGAHYSYTTEETTLGCKGWKGFFKESKAYVGYNTRKEKIAFWKGLPRAWIVFHWEWFKYHLNKVMLKVSDTLNFTWRKENV